MNQLDIVYCKNCKYYKQTTKHNNNLCSCSIESSNFHVVMPELYCNKTCYKKRNIFNNNKN